ncbi:hypothetical protein SAMN04488005_1993 [Yoonia tamlensis]|uniref:Uncharacterized protein n=1 Tax=Yoonia tamlensis TaxID=390270 RepID=A0A1I6GPG3_9RHOB|nr:hypothetical protein [Yoonia tamlensis]SFR44113.1 hypothetical protein SAMN04488005_1993 [Yoonia tamlensis]
MHYITLAAAALLATPMTAGEITSYYADLDAADMRNSGGAVLRDMGAVLQQDRANVHRFGITQEGDEIDAVFADRDMRAQIPALYANGPKVDGLAGWIARGQSIRVFVSICGTKSRPDYMIVNFGDGALAYTCD